MVQIKQGMDALNPAQLADYGADVVLAVDGNPNFPAPNPPLTTVTGLVQNIRTEQNTLTGILNEEAASRLRLRDLRASLKTALTNLGVYVLGIANTKPTDAQAKIVVQSAHMEVRDEAAPIGQLLAPDRVSLVDGQDDGELEAHCAKVRGASSYEWQTKTGDDPFAGEWKIAGVSTKSSATLKGYTQGQRVWMRCAGVGADDSRTWSQPISAVVT